MTNIGPRTEREQLIAEAAHLQGYVEGYADGTAGVQKLSERLRQRGLAALAELEPEPKQEGVTQ